jgi:hypothetical protein
LDQNTTTMEDVSDPAFSDVNDLDHGDGSSSSSSSSSSIPVLYEPVPFVPLTTERMLEDYASACAATQNILLSLHAEQMATKWVTGPIIQTPAFHQLLGIHPTTSTTTRVVALIMVGQEEEDNNNNNNVAAPRTTTTSSLGMDYFNKLLQQQQQRARRKRRTWNDILRDL